MDKRTSRACVFIDSSNPSMPSQVINGAKPFIKPPFPPTIEPRDLLKKSRDGSLAKAPNAFIIYRKWFIETARSEGYFLPMTVISSMASQSWEQESADVKEEYKRLGKEAFNLRNEMLPKSIRRRKREKWNIVTFDDDDNKLENHSIKAIKKPIRKKSSEVPQLPLSPSLSTESIESTQSTPITSPLASPVTSPSSPNSSGKELARFTIPSPVISTFEETFIEETADSSNELNNWFSSPEQSSISSPENSNEQYLLESTSSQTFELFTDSPIIDLIQRQGSPPYLDGLGINTDNLFNDFSSKYFPSQDFLNTEPSSGMDFYYRYI